MGRSSPRMALASPTSEDLVDRTPRVRVRPCHVGRRARVAVWHLHGRWGRAWACRGACRATWALPAPCLSLRTVLHFLTKSTILHLPTVLQDFVNLRGLHISAPLQVHVCRCRVRGAAHSHRPQSPRPTRSAQLQGTLLFGVSPEGICKPQIQKGPIGIRAQRGKESERA